MTTATALELCQLAVELFIAIGVLSVATMLDRIHKTLQHLLRELRVQRPDGAFDWDAEG